EKLACLVASQASERTLAQLPHALSAHTERMPDLLERHRLVTAETVIHHEHLPLARAQYIHRAIEGRSPRLIFYRWSSAWRIVGRLDGDDVRQRETWRISAPSSNWLVERVRRLRQSADATHELD